jgi:putative SOS response-associated peptidase YedK
LAALRWGLVPSWAKEGAIGNRLINARAETLAEKPSFRAAFRARRCLVAADGFYEWRQEGEAKQPYRIARRDGGPFAFAGLWERWAPAGAEAIESFTIVTSDASALLRPIHERMPALLRPEDHAAWLGGDTDQAKAALGRLLPDALLEAYPVSRRVNSPRHDDPACIERA